VKSTQPLFASAEEAYRNKDEEKAYILYMRYFNVIQSVKKSAEYKKNKVFWHSICRASIVCLHCC